MKKNQSSKGRWLLGFVTVCLLSAVFYIKDNLGKEGEIQTLSRKSPGMGETEVCLEIRTEEGTFPVEIQIDERIYSETELEQVFQKGKEWLDSVILSENESFDRVTKDLELPTYIENSRLSVRWEVERSDWIQYDGKLTEEARIDTPKTTKICAILSYGETEKSYIYEITLVNSNLTKEENIQSEAVIVLESLNDENPTEETVALPTNLNGKPISWYIQKPAIWPKVFLFGNIILVLLYFTKEEKKMQELKNREAELGRDYPDIVYRLVLLIGAGMTVKHAWEKLIEEYEREKKVTGKTRWGYEEMEAALREMTYGIAEIKAYENFGNRCGSQNYIRLSALLVQQVRRGARGMNALLLQEVSEAEILWRENSRKRAEEAGTKLLLPMILLMSVVFAVLMIPAFLSIMI